MLLEDKISLKPSADFTHMAINKFRPQQQQIAFFRINTNRLRHEEKTTRNRRQLNVHMETTPLFEANLLLISLLDT